MFFSPWRFLQKLWARYAETLGTLWARLWAHFGHGPGPNFGHTSGTLRARFRAHFGHTSGTLRARFRQASEDHFGQASGRSLQKTPGRLWERNSGPSLKLWAHFGHVSAANFGHGSGENSRTSCGTSFVCKAFCGTRWELCSESSLWATWHTAVPKDRAQSFVFDPVTTWDTVGPREPKIGSLSLSMELISKVHLGAAPPPPPL